MSSISIADRAKAWGMASRAFAFPASIVPVVVGATFAWWSTGLFHWGLFILALIAGMLYHTGCNVINDIFDYRQGIDYEGGMGGSGAIVSGRLSIREAFIGSYVFLGLGSLIGLFFVWFFSDWCTISHGLPTYPWGWPMLVLGIAGLLGSIFYTTTPLSAKYAALGEPLVFLMMGTGMVLGGFFVITGTMTWAAVWVSIPVGCLVAAILQSNDTRDIADDREAKIKTASILFGARGARVFYSALLFGGYVSVLALALTGIIPWFGLLPLITLPLALKLHKLHWTDLSEKPEYLRDGPELTAKLHLPFGLLLAIGLIIGHWFPWAGF